MICCPKEQWRGPPSLGPSEWWWRLNCSNSSKCWGKMFKLENGKYNLLLVCFNKIQKIFIWVYAEIFFLQKTCFHSIIFCFVFPNLFFQYRRDFSPENMLPLHHFLLSISKPVLSISQRFFSRKHATVTSFFASYFQNYSLNIAEIFLQKTCFRSIIFCFVFPNLFFQYRRDFSPENMLPLHHFLLRISKPILSISACVAIIKVVVLHAEKSFYNLVNTNQIWIAFTLFW